MSVSHISQASLQDWLKCHSLLTPVKTTCKPCSETWSEASVVLPHWFVARFWTTLVLITFPALLVNNNASDQKHVGDYFSPDLMVKFYWDMNRVLETSEKMSTHITHLSHIPSLRRVAVRGASAVAPAHKVRWVAASTGEGWSPLLLLLHVTLGGAVSFLPLLLTLPLSIAGVVARGGPPAWVTPVAVPISCVLAPLHRDSTRTSNIGCLSTLR